MKETPLLQRLADKWGVSVSFEINPETGTVDFEIWGGSEEARAGFIREAEQYRPYTFVFRYTNKVKERIDNFIAELCIEGVSAEEIKKLFEDSLGRGMPQKKQKKKPTMSDEVRQSILRAIRAQAKITGEDFTDEFMDLLSWYD